MKIPNVLTTVPPTMTDEVLANATDGVRKSTVEAFVNVNNSALRTNQTIPDATWTQLEASGSLFFALTTNNGAGTGRFVMSLRIGFDRPGTDMYILIQQPASGGHPARQPKQNILVQKGWYVHREILVDPGATARWCGAYLYPHAEVYTH